MNIMQCSDVRYLLEESRGHYTSPQGLIAYCNTQACRGYEIIHPYPYPYPQIFRGYPWIYPYPQMPIIYRLTCRPMH